MAPNHESINRTADLTRNEAVRQLADQVQEQFGGADIVVNCAGARGAAGDFLGLRKRPQ